MGLITSVNPAKIAIALGVIVAFVLMTPTGKDARTFFLNVSLTAYLLPSLVIFSCADKPIPSALIIWSALVIVYAISAVSLQRIVFFKIRSKTIMVGLALSSGGLIAAMFLLGGHEYFNLNLNRVYEFRRAAAEGLPGIFSYLSPIFAKVVIPFGMAVALYYRRYIFVGFFIGASILLFGITGNKFVLFSPIIFTCIFLLLSWQKRYSFILCIFIGALLIGSVDGYFASISDLGLLVGLVWIAVYSQGAPDSAAS